MPASAEVNNWKFWNQVYFGDTQNLEFCICRHTTNALTWSPVKSSSSSSWGISSFARMPRCRPQPWRLLTLYISPTFLPVHSSDRWVEMRYQKSNSSRNTLTAFANWSFLNCAHSEVQVFKMLSMLSCPTHSGPTAQRTGHQWRRPPATPQFAGATYLGTARHTAAVAAPVAAGQGNPAAGTAGTSGLGTKNSVGCELVPELYHQDQMHDILAVWLAEITCTNYRF